ncbi:MAG: PEGA domain-containing protein [Deltaproteobacteria bacterium]|nr:PEGA domain-containing protein [Deltaproteobacteria bacterium]
MLRRPLRQRLRFSIGIGAILATILLLAPQAHAQDAATQNAKRHFDVGQALYLQGKFSAAAESFVKAYAAKSFPAFLFNVAVAYEKNKDFAKALKYYEKFLIANPHSSDAGLVKKRIKAISKHLSPPTPSTQSTTSAPAAPAMPTLPPISTKGVVVIESQPEGAAIYLNNKKSGIFTRTPYTGSLPPGRHTLIIELKDFAPIRKTISVQNDVLSYLYFAMARQKNLGWIEIKGNIPNARVYLDSRKFRSVGTARYTGNLRPGKRKIIIERPGFEPFIKELTVIAGKTHVVNFTLQKVGHGWLKITGRTTHGAAIKVDGQPFRCDNDEYPCHGKIAKGTHKVTLMKEGHKTYETSIEVAPAHEVQVAVRLNPKPSRLKAYITLGVAAAVLGTGIAFGVMSNNRKSSLESDLQNGNIYDSDDSRLTEGKIFAIIANSAFAASGLVAGLGIYYLFRKEGAESFGETRTRKLAIMPLLSPHVAGVAGTVRF